MIDSINEFFRQALGNDYLTLYVISIIPVIELRGALVFMASMEDVMSSFTNIVCGMLCCIAGSTTVVFPLLLITRPLIRKMKQTKLLSKVAKSMEDNLQDRAKDAYDEKMYEGKGRRQLKADTKKAIGLFIFVAVPLPMTGAWTGSLAGSFLDFPNWKAFLSITAGNIVAAVILTALGYFLQAYAEVYLYGFVVLAIILAVAFGVSRAKKREKKIAEEKAKFKTDAEYELFKIKKEEGDDIIKKEFIDENGDKHIIIGKDEKKNSKFYDEDSI